MAFLNSLQKFFLNRNNIIGLIIAFSGAFLLAPSVFLHVYGSITGENYSGRALDPSWILTLNYTSMQNLTWGKDFAFTFGPLAFLGTRVGWGMNKYWFVIYDAFYIINLFAVFFISYTRSVNKVIALILIAAVMVIMPTFLGGGNSLVFLMFLIFWIVLNIQKPHFIYYTFQIVLITLLFYVKFNTSFIAVGFFYVSLLYLGIFKKQKIWVLLAYALMQIGAILVFANILKVDLGGYIISGMHMVSGYNEIMYLDIPETVAWLKFTLFFIGFVAVFLLVKLVKEKDKRYENLMIMFLFAVCFFVLYKQAFVRGDIFHVNEFYKYCPLLLLSVPLFTGYEFKNKMNILVPIMIAIPIFINFKYSPHARTGLEGKFSKKTYFEQLETFEEINGGVMFTPGVNQFPERIKQKIGNTPTDAYPCNSYMLYENKINYMPRPVIQAYAAYTPYLENLNFEYYNSDKAPKYVIYDHESIDMRYPLFDEPKVNLVFLKNYKVVDSFDFNERHLLLLEKKPDAKPVALKLIREYAMYLDTPLRPKEGVYYEVGVYNTLVAKARSVLYYAPPIALNIKTVDNTVLDFKTSKPLLLAGLFSSRLVASTEDFRQMMNGDSIPNNKKIKEYRAMPNSKRSFKEKIRIKEYQIK